MFKTGIVSVTYRHLSSDETISAARSAGLEAIEWGGDIHVPPENIGNARAVGEATRAAGLEVVSYGTYYRLGENGRNFEVKFAETLAAAKALGAPSLRIWAGSKDACDTGEAERKELVRELRVCADMAAREGERIALEFHQKTLTSDADSAERLVGEVGRENLSLYWQPNQFLTFERNIENLTTVLPFISTSMFSRGRAVSDFVWRSIVSGGGGISISLPRAGAATLCCLNLFRTTTPPSCLTRRRSLNG